MVLGHTSHTYSAYKHNRIIYMKINSQHTVRPLPPIQQYKTSNNILQKIAGSSLLPAYCSGMLEAHNGETWIMHALYVGWWHRGPPHEQYTRILDSFSFNSHINKHIDSTKHNLRYGISTCPFVCIVFYPINELFYMLTYLIIQKKCKTYWI